MVERLYKVETHCFGHDGCYILLDVARSKFFTISPLERDIMAAQQGTQLEALRYELTKTYDDRAIKQGLEKLKEHGVISSRCPIPAKADAQDLSPVTLLELNIAQDCNLRCEYCCVGQGGFGGQRQRMSHRVAQQAVDFLLEESGEAELCTLLFIGGEPMVNPALIKDIVAYSQVEAAKRGKQMAYRLATNATLLDDENIAFIKKYNIKVQVSLDGPPEVHDRMRHTASGRGSYASIVAHLPQLLVSYTDQVNIRATITRHSPPALEILEHLAKFGAGRVVLSWVLGDDKNALDLAGREQLKTEYTKLAQYVLARASRDDFAAADIFFLYYWECYLAFFCRGRKRQFFCNAGTGRLGVSASGGLYPCKDLAEMEDYRLGHVATGLEPEKLENWKSYLDVDKKSVCQNCWARYICGGGCLSAAIKFNGSPHRPFEAECDLLRHLIQLSMWLHLNLRENHPQFFLRFLSQVDANGL